MTPGHLLHFQMKTAQLLGSITSCWQIQLMSRLHHRVSRIVEYTLRPPSTWFLLHILLLHRPTLSTSCTPYQAQFLQLLLHLFSSCYNHLQTHILVTLSHHSNPLLPFHTAWIVYSATPHKGTHNEL